MTHQRSISTISSYVHYYLFLFQLLSRIITALDGGEYWIGFSFELTHIAASIAYANNTVIDITTLEAGPEYETWVLENLQKAIHNQRFGSFKGDVDSSEYTRWDENNSIQSSSLDILTDGKPSSIQQEGISHARILSPEETSIAPAQLMLNHLIQLLKSKTEETLGTQITNITISFPGFFNPTQNSNLREALRAASLISSNCFDLQDSSAAAALAYRNHKFCPHKKPNITCLFGPPGVEEIITVESTEKVVVFSKFNLFTGEKFIAMQNIDYFVAFKEAPDTLNENLFWGNVTTGVRKLVTKGKQMCERFALLLLIGDSRYDSHLIEVINSSIGEIVSSKGGSLVVRISISQEELQHITEDEIRRSIGLSCRYNDHSDERMLRAFEHNLFSAEGPETQEQAIRTEAIDRVQASSRGAALIGMATNILSCPERSKGRDIADFHDGRYLRRKYGGSSWWRTCFPPRN